MEFHPVCSLKLNKPAAHVMGVQFMTLSQSSLRHIEDFVRSRFSVQVPPETLINFHCVCKGEMEKLYVMLALHEVCYAP
jgi:predicted aconitase